MMMSTWSRLFFCAGSLRAVSTLVRCAASLSSTKSATRICKEDPNEVVTDFLQDESTLEQGLFDKENIVPQDLTQVRMGKIVRERYPELSEQDPTGDVRRVAVTGAEFF